MPLYKQTTGTGPDLVMIHGWGLHSGIWDSVMPLLEPHVRVTRVDLPGHGRSDWSGGGGLDDMVAAVAEVVPDNAVWLGWSLGGLLAMRATVRPEVGVKALITVASSPCFVRRPGWQSALLPSLLQTFAAELEQDYQRTLDRFLALQVRGSEQATSVLKSLRSVMQMHGEPHPAGLRAGLDILADSDLRASLPSIDCPVLLLAGERDTLVPPAAVQATRELLPDARLTVLPGAGHAPFISDPALFAQTIKAFLTELDTEYPHA